MQARIRRSLLAASLLALLLVRLIPHMGEWYARCLYPTLSAILSGMARCVPFSLTEWVVVCAALSMVTYPVMARRRKSRRHILAMEAELLGWMVVWFYGGWALNYNRDSLYERTAVERREADKEEFRRFLDGYIARLNASYTPLDSIDKEQTHRQIKAIYSGLPENCGLARPKDFQQPKRLCFNSLYSAVGVLGYMGPFAAESHLNEDLRPVQYAFTYAHELSHLLAVSNEGEANYWAYTICSRSHDRAIRYSGHFCIMGIVMGNAKGILSKEEYDGYLKQIDSRIMDEYTAVHDFWKAQRNPWLDKAQDLMLNALLKGNGISAGTMSYNEVVQYIISFDGKI